MTSEVAAGERPVPMASESPALASLRRAYEARGFTFLAEPPRDALPDFLGAYRPDAIARGPGGGIIIEVKRGGRAHRESALAEVARRVAGQEGWEFRVGDRPEPGGPYTDPRNERRAHRSAVAWSWPRLAGAHPPHPQVLDGLMRQRPLPRRGLLRFRLRGIEKARTVGLWHALAHNMTCIGRPLAT